MSSAEPSQPSRSSPGAEPRGPWLFWGTMVWLSLAFIVSIAAQIGAFVVTLLPQMAANPGVKIDIEAAAADFNTISMLLLVSYPIMLGVLVVAVRLRRWRVQDYFALHAITWRQFGYGCAALFATLFVVGLIGMATGHEAEPDFMSELFETLRSNGNVPLLFITIVLVGPIAEELVFRGFLFRGLAASRTGIMGAVIIGSALWAVIHTQYDAFYMGVVFIIGLVFGGLRAWSGATTLPIALHILLNGLSFAQAWLPQSQ